MTPLRLILWTSINYAYVVTFFTDGEVSFTSVPRMHLMKILNESSWLYYHSNSC